MRMIPPNPSTETESTAERRVFEALANSRATDGWIGLHSLSLTQHPNRLHGEADFVLVGPPGVFVIEVKGGRVGCENGVWHFTDKYDRVHAKTRSPEAQAREAAHAIRESLKPSLEDRWWSNLLIGHGLMFPDCRGSLVGPELDLDLLCDGDDFSRGIDSYLERLVEAWRRKLPNKVRNLPPEIVQRILTSLRPNFEFLQSVRSQVSFLNQTQVAATERQYAVLDAARGNSRLLVSGGAGTGKTLLAIECARREAQSGNKVLLVCHNPMLSRHLADSLRDTKSVRVTTANKLMLDTAKECSVPLGEYRSSMRADDPWFLKHLLPNVLALPKLDSSRMVDVLIIDEGQDLFDWDLMEFLGGFLTGGIENGRWRIFHDRFNQGAIRGLEGALEVEELLSERAPSLQLDTNCRNTGSIVNETRIATGADLIRTSSIDGPPVQYTVASTAEETARALAAWLHTMLEEGAEPSQITILSPLDFPHSAASSLPAALKNRISVIQADQSVFPAPGISFSTITDFKGLENMHVAMVDLGEISTPTALSELYVAMTRPRVSLWMAVSPELREWITSRKLQSMLEPS